MKLQYAQSMIDGTLKAARSNQRQPLAVVVLDAGGHPLASAREDGASLFRFDIARAKAHGALGMGADTRVLTERAKGNPVFYASVSSVVGGDIAFSPGGVLVRDASGVLLGAIGISGDTGEVDEECGLAGIEAAGLRGGAAV